MRAPVIGISAAFGRAVFDGFDEACNLVPRSYVDAVQRAGGLALVLPVGDADAASGLVDLVDGMLITGGSDIDPAGYGAPVHPATVGVTPRRDEFEIALARECIAVDRPLVGVCRGMQLINVALGGTLVQDLAGEDGHRRNLGTFEGNEHEVETAPGTLAEALMGAGIHRVSSHHHQGLDRVGRDLVVSAWSRPDGLVEAIELPQARFVLGVQWHPEVDLSGPVVTGLVRAAGG